MDLNRIITVSSTTLEKQNTLLEKCNTMSARYGLSISHAGLLRLDAGRREALARMGRVELSGGVLDAIVFGFCDSPYMENDTYEDTLAELQDMFYYLKNLTRDSLNDEEVIHGMRLIFDNVHGELAYFSDIERKDFYRIATTGDFEDTVFDRTEKREIPQED